MFHDKRVEHISHKLDIEEHVIEEVLDIMYDYIKLKIENVELEEGVKLDKEEFTEKFPIIHVPSLGYLKPSYGKYKHINKKKKKNE